MNKILLQTSIPTHLGRTSCSLATATFSKLMLIQLSEFSVTE